MREIDRNQMRDVQLAMLAYFADFCKDNDLRWWLDFGTLLGAVRHKGYIPWDDDIDVSMMREDYEKLKKLFNGTSNRYKLLDTELDRTYPYTFGKIVDTETVLYEGTQEVITIGVYLDIFAVDHAPANEKEYMKMLKRRDFLGKLRKVKLLEENHDIRTVRMKMIIALKRLLVFVPMHVIVRLINNNAKKYKGVKTGKIANFQWPYGNFDFYKDENYFEEIIELDFEGKAYPAPARYDEWLTHLYGDYMTLPPVEKREQHNVRAFIK